MRESAKCQRLLLHSGRLVTWCSHQLLRLSALPLCDKLRHIRAGGSTGVQFVFLPNTVIHFGDGACVSAGLTVVISIYFFPPCHSLVMLFPFHLLFKVSLTDAPLHQKQWSCFSFRLNHFYQSATGRKTTKKSLLGLRWFCSPLSRPRRSFSRLHVCGPSLIHVWVE